jgi:hypothetical protein
MIWGSAPIKQQFEVAPYSLTSNELKLLKHSEFIKPYSKAYGLENLVFESI